MNRSMTEESDMVQEECRTTIIVRDINISPIMVFSQQMEESKLMKEKARKKKRCRMDADKSFHDRSDGHGRFRKQQRYSIHDSYNTPRFDKETGSGSSFPKSTSTNCGGIHYGKCLASMDGCYGCGKDGTRDYAVLKVKIREDMKVSSSSGHVDPKEGQV